MPHSHLSSVTLIELPEDHVIARLSPAAPMPAAILSASPAGSFVSITRTPLELSIVCPTALAPEGAELDGPWRAFHARGPMPFGLTGVVTSLVAPLSAEGCPVFVTSTFDGDILMVPSSNHAEARSLLVAAGHRLES